MSLVHHDLSANDRTAMQALSGQLAAHPALRFSPASRPAFEAIMEATPLAADVTCFPRHVGGVPGLWCRPADARPDAAVLYLHGGSYILGSARSGARLASQLAARSGTAVFVADYRLAPEHPFPAAVDDAVAAWAGLEALGFARLALAGDSAGGGSRSSRSS